MTKEKLTEKLNAITVTKSMKDVIIQIAYTEDIHIQQACRKLLNLGLKEYQEKKRVI